MNRSLNALNIRLVCARIKVLSLCCFTCILIDDKKSRANNYQIDEKTVNFNSNNRIIIKHNSRHVDND
jgi:hypothetical protein